MSRKQPPERIRFRGAEYVRAAEGDLQDRMEDLITELIDGLENLLTDLNARHKQMYDEFRASGSDEDVMWDLFGVYKEAVQKVEQAREGLLRDPAVYWRGVKAPNVPQR